MINTWAKSIALGVLVALVGIGAFGRFYTARFNGLVSTRAMEIGDIAEQLRFGHGMTTRIIRPLALAYSQPNEAGLMPELLHAPLYPYLLSWLFKVRTSSGDASVAIFNGLMYLFTGWVLFVISRALWDKTVGVLVVVLYFLSVESLGVALSAIGSTLGGLLLTIAVWAALRNRQTSTRDRTPSQTGSPSDSPVWPAIVGVMLGLACLVGVVSLLLVLPVAVLATAGARARRRQLAIIALAVVVVLVPWGVRNLLVSGTVLPPLAKYTLLVDTQSYPGQSVFQQMPGQVPSPIQFVLTRPGEILNKMGNGLTTVYRMGPRVLNVYLFAFFILAAFQFGRQDVKRSLWRVVVAAAVLQALSICLFSLPVDSMAILLPLALCLAVGALIETLRRTEATRFVQVLVAVLICSLVVFPTISSAVLGGKMPRSRSLASVGLLKEHFMDDAVIATDNPAAVAWYAYKQAVWLPPTVDDLDALEQQGIKVDYIYLSQTVGGMLTPQSRVVWQGMLRSKEGPEKLGKLLLMPNGEMLFERVNKRKT